MPRSGPKRRQPGRVPAHPILLGLDLTEWAGVRIAKGGRRDALLGRVETLRLSLDGRSIEARVRGNRPLPYQVRVWVHEPQAAVRCTCSSEKPGPCRHAVAAVEALRFPAPPATSSVKKSRRGPSGRRGAGRGRIIQHAPAAPGFVILGGAERTSTRDERIALARDEEILLRRQRARRDRAKVHPVEGDSPPRFEVHVPRGDSVDTVTLRHSTAELFSCTCDDYAGNELETCRHIEKVRNWRSRQKKADRVEPSARMVSFWWRPRAWSERVPEPLQELRVDLAHGTLPDDLAHHFDAAGWLRVCPDETRPVAWATAARETARSYANRHGWIWDVDPAADRSIAAAARDERRHGARTPGEDLWSRIAPGLGLDLHPYQVEGARFLARRGRGFLADDMGLGKTAQAIVGALLLRRTAGARKTLIVCPASLKYQWSSEIDKVCGESACVVDGPRAERLAAYAAWTDGFLILNYELVLRDLDAIRGASADIIVLDEAQRIKNWDTKTARAVKRLESPHAFILTGTPLENRLIELHSLVEFLHPRALGPRWRLIPFHAVTEATGRIVAYEGLDVMRRRLSGFFLRRERRAVQDQLPERTDNTFWIGMTPLQRRPYRQHASAAAALLSKAAPLTPGEVRGLLRALTSMRILCNAHAQYAWNDTAPRMLDPQPPGRNEIRGLGSPKLEEFARVLEDLLDESETKVVVFSQWERMLRLAHFAVRELLDLRDLRAEVFHGALNSRARTEMLEAFRIDPEFRVMFSTDAGGLGLNLQESASIVVNLEVPWNPAILEQRIGRVHRLGQRRSVQVLHFVTRDAIEERVRQVVESKRALFDGLLVQQADSVVLDEGARSSFMDRVRSLIGD